MNKDFSIRFKNHKCFSEENIIEGIKTVNLLIGRNNCGKTSLLDVIERVLSKSKIENSLIGNCVIDYKTKIPEDIYSCVFSRNQYLGINYYNQENSLYELGKELLDKECFFPFQNSNHVDPLYDSLVKKKHNVFTTDRWYSLKKLIIDDIEKYDTYKISAERDIKKEKRENGYAVIDSNGNGITKLVEQYLYSTDGNYKLIKEDVLNALNDILNGESAYSDIDVLNKEDILEIYLYENDRRIPLSSMGSGLKTIIFVLLQLFRSAEHNSRSLFLFEELENNLHPEIQRRLLNYIHDFASKHDSLVFITSHSHVAINCFYDKSDCAIYHIYKKVNNSSIVESIKNDADKAMILNDLGVLASDIFQTNGIIWVEGPSDRIYIKKWLAVKYPNIHENEHFSFLYYGGKVLSHFTVNKEEDDLINVLLTNRNGLIVMDHDGNSSIDEIRETKKRIKEEFESNNMYVWITKGKEIENYLTASDINSMYNDSSLEQVEAFQPFKDYISSVESNFANQKVAFSQKISFDMNSLKIMDLEKRIDDIAKIIKEWNKNISFDMEAE